MDVKAANEDLASHRLFIGGLFDAVTQKDIRERFISFGRVDDIHIIQRKAENGQIWKTFCFMDINASKANINRCISIYSKSKWKGNEIKVQIAKENFLARLEKERTSKENDTKDNVTSELSRKGYEAIEQKVSKMKAIVPGTKILEEPNWIVGKYGRPLPIVRLRDRSTKFIRFDPSKHCHQLRKIASDKVEMDDRVSDLLWSLEEDYCEGKEGRCRRKRKGNAEPVSVDRPKNCKKPKSALRIDAADIVYDLKEVKKGKSCLSSEESDCCILSDGSKSKSFVEKSLSASSKSFDEDNEQNKKPSQRIKVKKDVSRMTQSSPRITEAVSPYEKVQKCEDFPFYGTNEMPVIKVKEKSQKTGKGNDIIPMPMDIVGSVGNFDVESVGNRSLSESDSDQMMRSQELNGNSFRLGESIISQIARKRRSNSNGDSLPVFDNDADNLNLPEIFTCGEGQTPESHHQISNDEVSNTSEDGSCESSSDENSELSVDHEVLSKGKENSKDEKNVLVGSDSSVKSSSTSSEDSEYSCLESTIVDKQLSPEGSNTFSEGYKVSLGKQFFSDEDEAPDNENRDSEDKSSASESEGSSIDDDELFDDHPREVNNKRDADEVRKSIAGPEIESKTVQKSNELNKNGKKKSENGQKKEVSENKRMQSLNERKKKEIEKKSLVTQALKSENLAGKQSSCIQFESSDEENDRCENSSERNNGKNDTKKVAGSAALSWLGLEDTDGSEDEDQSRFAIKKQFEGAEGAELFKLHKKAALDERFKIDKRFQENVKDIESQIEGETIEDGNNYDDGNDLSQEKSRALSILDDLLGKRPKDIETNTSNKILDDVVRYDPLDDVHAKYEAVEESMESDGGEEDPVKEENPPEKPCPDVDKNTFYDVSSNLKSLFAAKETNTFSFLNNDNESKSPAKDACIGDAETLKKSKYSAPIRPFDDESGDEDTFADKNPIETSDQKALLNNKQSFFFTRDDQRLKSDALDSPSGFMRTVSVEELYQQLEANRERLRQDYKRKHKDAVRRMRKKKSASSR